MPYAVDLFCGAGGMSEGLLQAGFDIVFSNDINEQAMRTYVNRHEQLGFKKDYNTFPYVGDIRDLTGTFIMDSIKKLEVFSEKNVEAPRQIDAIFGGPPCQGFSRAGKRNAEDPRNFLFKEYIRIISELLPNYVILENVEGLLDTRLINFKGLLGHCYGEDDCLVPHILKTELNALGYNVQISTLDASDYGVPQRRRRVVLIANKYGHATPKTPVATVKQPITFIEAIGDLLRNEENLLKWNAIKTEYQITSASGRTPSATNKPIPTDFVMNNELSSHKKVIEERFSLFYEGEKGTEVRKRIQMNGIDLSDKPSLTSYCAKALDCSEQEIIKRYRGKNLPNELIDVLLTKKTIRTRLWSNKPSLTMMTIADDYIHPIENRCLTVREMARLQSFDDSFEFLGKRTTGGLRRRIEIPQYSQVGNAVPPLLAKAIALEVINAINSSR